MSIVNTVREGRLETLKELLETISISNLERLDLLTEAIKYKHSDCTKLLLVNGYAVNSKSTKPTNTPLHFAVQNGDTEIVKMLLDGGAKIDAINEYGTAPIHIATANGNIEIVGLLINRLAAVNVREENGKTPLCIAAKKGYSEIVEHLLKREAYVTFALEKGISIIADQILKYFPGVNKCNRRYILRAVCGYANECKNFAESLLHYDFTSNPEKVNNSELLQASLEKIYSKIREDLLKYNSDVIKQIILKYKCQPLLYTATQNKLKQIAKYHGSDINAKDVRGRTPLLYAAQKGYVKVVQVLIKYNADITAMDVLYGSMLHFCAKVGNEVLCQIFLDRGMDVNAINYCHQTALHISAERGDAFVGKMLLDAGACVNATDIFGYTALYLSARVGNTILCKMILESGANVNSKCKSRQTPLHIAIEKGYKEVVQLLLQYGAQVNSKNKRGKTPLHLAACEGYLDIIMILLKFGADVHSTDDFGYTPLHIASMANYAPVIRTLLDYGSDNKAVNKDKMTPDDISRGARSPLYHKLYTEYCECFDDHDGALSSKKHRDVYGYNTEKIRAANLDQSFMQYYRIDFQIDCKKEIEIMRTEKISNCNVSFYDILTKSASHLAMYLNNKDIVQVLKLNYLKIKFPMHACAILNNSKKAIIRKELFDESIKNCYYLFKNCPDLPHVCIDKILSYCSDNDLSNFIAVCKILTNANCANINATIATDVPTESEMTQ